MWQVYTCIANEHDLRMVAVAAAVCFLACFTAFATFDQSRAGGVRRPIWGVIAALVSGIGIWATHFVAMLAYDPRIPVGYDLGTTILSVVIAVVLTGCGWAAATLRGVRGPLLGGALIAAGIGGMHYTGMAGGRIVWDESLILISLLLGLALSVAALAEHRRRQQDIPWRPATLLALAICSLHFIAMGAVGIYPDPNFVVPPQAVDTGMLAVAVTGAAILILATSFVVALFDRGVARRELAEAQRLKGMAEALVEAAAARERLSDDLKRQADISAAALGNMAQGLSLYDKDDRLVAFNRRYVELYDLPEELLVPGTSISDILRHMVEKGKYPGPLDYYLGQVAGAGSAAGQTEITMGCGRIIDVQRRPLPDGGWVATHEDITERQRSSDHISFLARHDVLTGLPNRASFTQEIRNWATRLDEGRRFALHTVDLDRFKEVNDTLGHGFGDEILKQAADRLREVVGERGFITRLGGDEFAIIQIDADRESAAALADHIVRSLSVPFAFDGHTTAIGASVGVALAPDDDRDGDALLKKSDLALHRSKTENKGSFRFFEAGMDSRLRERRDLERDLRVAIQKGRFELHYQPIVNFATGTIVAFEALVRWRHPTRGLIQPADFIPIAEDTHLILPIGEWVLRQACRDAVTWPSAIRVAVNLSAAQFKRGDLLAMTKSALGAAGLGPDRLELEITESVLLHDEAWVLSILHDLRKLGVRIAMDDFGTGYSSLSYLRSFPFTKIKIDRGFVADVARTDDGRAIVQATIQLSEKLGMVTTAEGVETADQMSILSAEGCTEAQGFHISQAVPATEVSRLLADYNSGDASTETAGRGSPPTLIRAAGRRR
ncbi:EAL domain-containing protein [Sphingosinicella sp.]|uniref:EAL domain-containing protein n=1 Tax=Sphingosinicella sp. TaxID=1917971 RepID=UPI0040378A7A